MPRQKTIAGDGLSAEDATVSTAGSSRSRTSISAPSTRKQMAPGASATAAPPSSTATVAGTTSAAATAATERIGVTRSEARAEIKTAAGLRA